MSPFLKVTKYDGEKSIWAVSNDRKLDASRSLVSKDFSINSGESIFEFSYRYSNRPPFLTALLRAWSWSVLDYLENPEGYWKYNLYNRSTPLYSALAVVALLSVPLFIRTYRDKQTYSLLKAHLRELEIKKNEAVIALAEEQRTTTERIQERDKKLAEITKDLEKVRLEAANISEESNQLLALGEAEILEVKSERQELINEREELQKAKETLESQYAKINSELVSTKSAMENLKSLSKVQFHIENSITGDVANQTKLAKDSRAYNKLKAHLKKWILLKGKADVNISMHGTKKVISDALEKIDRDFIDEFFVHVNNERYSSAERRTIKVLPISDQNSYSGVINVYIDHDYGCALSFAFQTRNKAPVNNIGFVLAVLLRAVCKDFEDYTIKGIS